VDGLSNSRAQLVSDELHFVLESDPVKVHMGDIGYGKVCEIQSLFE
jgi:hypothetical protein